MKKIRIGNDIYITWTLTDSSGNPYDLTGREFEVWMVTWGIRIRVTDFTYNENVISWTYLGKDQKATGEFALLLVENRGGVAMVTYDTKDAFELVAHSWLTGDDDTEGVQTETVDIVSQIDTGAPVTAEEIIAALGYVPADEQDIPDVSDFVKSITPTVTKIWVGTQEQYDALTPQDDTLYFIKEEDGN